MGKRPDIPDLDLPSGRPSRPASTPSAAPARPQRPADEMFSNSIERGITAGPPSASPSHRGKAISVDFGLRDDEGFGDSLEHGAGSMSTPSMAPMSGGPRSAVSGVPSRAPASLELAYRRLDPANQPKEPFVPTTGEATAARVVPALGFAAAFAPLFHFAHHAGRYGITKLAPHAFDASSTVQSGIVSGVALAAAMTVGYFGLRSQRKSYAMVFAAGALLLTCLAMVTVTLVSTDETPQPPDGARLIPYLVPAAIALLGIGIAGRGVWPFFQGGARRALSVALGLLGGVVAFAGLALSIW